MFQIRHLAGGDPLRKRLASFVRLIATTLILFRRLLQHCPCYTVVSTLLQAQELQFLGASLNWGLRRSRCGCGSGSS